MPESTIPPEVEEIEEAELFCCDNCGYESEDADEYHVMSSYRREVRNCGDCTTSCYECGSTVLRDSCEYFDDVDDYVCEECWSYSDCCDRPQRNDGYDHNCECGGNLSSRGIHDYGHTTPSMYLGGPLPRDDKGHMNGYYIGFELEISADTHDANALPVYEWARKHMGATALICKEDSSVNGFEIVSEPMTPAFFESINWESLMELLNGDFPLYGEEPRDHGLHVHIGRVAFGRDDIATAAYAYLLSQADHLERIGRRSATGYCNKVQRPVSTVISQSRPHSKQGQKIRNEGVYAGRDAINLQNSATIEIRAFKSTRKASELRDAVRLTYVAAEYIRSLRVGRTAISPKALHWSAFARWTATNFPDAFASIAGLTAPKEDKKREPVLVATNFSE